MTLAKTPQDGYPSASGPEATVDRLVETWDHRQADVSHLLDRASSRLADEANHELRQVLVIATTELEMIERRTREDTATGAESSLDRLRDALDRAQRIVETHLDRDEVAKMLIRLTPEPVNLAEAVKNALSRHGVTPEHAAVEARLPPVEARADRRKLAVVLDNLVSLFWRDREEEAALCVSLEDRGDAARGFVGLDPPRRTRTELIERLQDPVDLESSRVDLPYDRAVVERHGGTLFVQGRGNALGLGFTLPTRGDES